MPEEKYFRRGMKKWLFFVALIVAIALFGAGYLYYNETENDVLREESVAVRDEGNSSDSETPDEDVPKKPLPDLNIMDHMDIGIGSDMMIVAKHEGEYKSSKSDTAVIVRLSAIEKLRVAQGDGLNIKVSYEKHKKADGYEVRCYDEAIGAFVQIKRTEYTDLTFITFVPDKVYSFSVRPYKKSGDRYYFANWCESEHIKVR